MSNVNRRPIKWPIKIAHIELKLYAVFNAKHAGKKSRRIWIFFFHLFFPERKIEYIKQIVGNMIGYFMQSVYYNLHEISKHIHWKNKIKLRKYEVIVCGTCPESNKG